MVIFNILPSIQQDNSDDYYLNLTEKAINGTLEEIKATDFPNLVLTPSYFLPVEGLKKLSLPNVVEAQSNIFYGCICNAIDNVYTIEELDLPRLKEIYKWNIVGPNRIKTINIPKVEILDDSALAYCPVLEDLSLPSIKTIGQDSMQSCTALKNVYIGPNITSINTKAFENCTQNTLTITIDTKENAITGAPWGATNATIIWAKAKSIIEKIIAREIVNISATDLVDTTDIGAYAFTGCTTLESVVTPDSVIYIC